MRSAVIQSKLQQAWALLNGAHAELWVAAFLGAALVADVARFSLLLHPRAQAPLTERPHSLSMPRPQFGLRKLLGAHLFGEAEASSVDTPSAASVSWVLSGVIATNNPEHGYAIISDAAHQSKLWAIGSHLPGERELYRVFADHIVLRVEGRYESLALPRERSGQEGSAMVAAISSPSAGSGADDHEPPELSRKIDLDHYRPPTSAEQWFSSIMPSAEGGELEIHPPGRAQKKYGLQPGDVLTAINGQPVTDAGGANAALAEITGGAFNLTVSRGGQTEVIAVSVGD